MDLRHNYTDLLVSLAQESTRSGSPIVRPLWWIAPTEDAALLVDQQFMLGEGFFYIGVKFIDLHRSSNLRCSSVFDEISDQLIVRP